MESMSPPKLRESPPRRQQPFDIPGNLVNLHVELPAEAKQRNVAG